MMLYCALLSVYCPPFGQGGLATHMQPWLSVSCLQTSVTRQLPPCHVNELRVSCP